MLPRTESAPLPGGPTVRRGFATAVHAWPLRRVVTAVLLFPMLLALLVGAGGGWAPRPAPGWTALVVLVSLAAASTLATYLPRPGAGRRLDVGCTPCATVAAVSVLAAAGVLSSAPHEVPTAILALGVAGFGLRQRLANPSTCASPRATG